MHPRIRKSLLLLAPIALLFGFAAVVGQGLYSANLHEVDAGRFWRCAQVSPERLAEIVHDKGIQAVVDLRNESASHALFGEEARVCREHDAEIRSVPLSPAHLPPPERLSDLITTFDRGPYPMLVHCRSGSDRAGLASMLYLVVEREVPFEEAVASQLSWRTGHLPVGDGRGIDQFVDLYRRTGRGRSLRDWLERDYPALYRRAETERTGIVPPPVHASARPPAALHARG